jgi:hypothetical protein
VATVLFSMDDHHDPYEPTEDEERVTKRAKGSQHVTKKCVFHSLARQSCKPTCIGLTQLGPWTHAQKKQYEPIFKRWGLMNIFFHHGKRGDPVAEGEFLNHLQHLSDLATETQVKQVDEKGPSALAQVS